LKPKTGAAYGIPAAALAGGYIYNKRRDQDEDDR
jgi:hypothetical protein